MNPKSYLLFVGIDLGGWLHQACVLDANGKLVRYEGFVHTPEALAQFLDWVLSLADCEPARLAVALEKPHGPVVESLQQRGMAVYAINPKKLDRFRDRFAVSGAKDDRRDAFVLASTLRTDRQAFQSVCPPSQTSIELGEWLKMDKELCEEEKALANRLREQLLRCFPHWLKLAPSKLIDPFFWEILDRLTSDRASTLPEPQAIRALLRQYHIRRLRADQVLDILRAPALLAAPGTPQAVTRHIRLLLPQLRLVHQQRRDCAKQLEQTLNQLRAPQQAEDPKLHTDAAILSSIPGVGNMVLATLLTEASDVLERRDLKALRALGGIAPVTKQSGKRRQVSMRRACKPALKNALYHWARIAVLRDPGFKEHYDLLRASGQPYARALRGVMDRILAIAIAMLRNGILYDPSRRSRCHGKKNR